MPGYTDFCAGTDLDASPIGALQSAMLTSSNAVQINSVVEYYRSVRCFVLFTDVKQTDGHSISGLSIE